MINLIRFQVNAKTGNNLYNDDKDVQKNKKEDSENELGDITALSLLRMQTDQILNKLENNPATNKNQHAKTIQEIKDLVLRVVKCSKSQPLSKDCKQYVKFVSESIIYLLVHEMNSFEKSKKLSDRNKLSASIKFLIYELQKIRNIPSISFYVSDTIDDEMRHFCDKGLEFCCSDLRNILRHNFN